MGQKTSQPKSISQQMWDMIEYLPTNDQRLILSKVFEKHMKANHDCNMDKLKRTKGEIIALINFPSEAAAKIAGDCLLVDAGGSDLDILKSISIALSTNDLSIINISSLFKKKLKTTRVLIKNYDNKRDNVMRTILRDLRYSRKKHASVFVVFNSEDATKLNIFDTFTMFAMY